MTKKLYNLLSRVLWENRDNKELKAFLRKYQRLAPDVFEIGTIVNEFDSSAPKIVNIRGLSPRLQHTLDKHDEAVRNYVEPPKRDKTLFTWLHEAQKTGVFRVREGVLEHRAEKHKENVEEKAKRLGRFVKKWDYRQVREHREAKHFAMCLQIIEIWEQKEQLDWELIKMRNSHYGHKEDPYKEELKNDTRQPNPTSDGDLQISA